MATNRYIILQTISETDANMWGGDATIHRRLLRNNNPRSKSVDTTTFTDVIYKHCLLIRAHAEKTMKYLKSINPTNQFSIKIIHK